MKNKNIFFTAVFLMTLPPSLQSADVPGRWIAVEPEPGTSVTIFTFTVNGTNLTGTVSGSETETHISEGKIDGNQFVFVAIRTLGGVKRKLLYKGEVSGNEIRFTRKAQDGTGKPQAFVAKRLVAVRKQQREFQHNGDIPLIKPEMPEPQPIK
jgi:hypothetical protein